MTSSSADVAGTGGLKRAYAAEDTALPTLPTTTLPHDVRPKTPPTKSAAAASAFRNVSACNRCRLRKNRCDTLLPKCTACERAGQKCVGFDPITKREIPRSYVFWLETRVNYLESLLQENEITFNPPEAFETGLHQAHGSRSRAQTHDTSDGAAVAGPHADSQSEEERKTWEKEQNEKQRLSKLVDDVGMVSVQGASDPRWLGSTSGIPFARVVFAAIKSSVSTNNTERGSVKPSNELESSDRPSNGNGMRDSFFGLHTKSTVKQAPFPERHLGEKMVRLYFEHANPQIPILHKGEFMALLNRSYETGNKRCTPRELYMLNMVFAIGAGIIFGSSVTEVEASSDYQRDPTSPLSKRARLASQQHQPEEYHASAIAHLEPILGSSNPDRSEGLGGGLEELQAVLLLAGFALLRPVPPGLWYIVGVALRLSIDLGLHFEAGSDLEIPDLNGPAAAAAHASSYQHRRSRSIDAREKGRREWMRDLRRRLFWSTYCFDRLVCTCVGRPVSISDDVITTQFPSPVDDESITKDGILSPQPDAPSYKYISHHYLRLRLLQSEILQVLQHEQARKIRCSRPPRLEDDAVPSLTSPFLDGFDSLRSWRKNIDRRLWEWRCSAPRQDATGVQFEPKFLELNYWQAVIMLYRQSLTVPDALQTEISPTVDVDVVSPSFSTEEEKEDEDDVFLKVAEAGQKVLRLYRELHRYRLVNYTFLATHHLFMAGISFLYAVWHSPIVRSRLTIDDVDFTVLAATSVLGDLMEKCPPAEACKEAFERMSKATVQMCLSTTGFGSRAGLQAASRTGSQQESILSRPSDSAVADASSTINQQAPPPRRPPPRFDMDLRDLFPDDIEHSLPSQSFPNSFISQQSMKAEVSDSEVPHYEASMTEDSYPQYLPSQINTQINQGFGVGVANVPSDPNEQARAHQAAYYEGNGPEMGINYANPGLNYLPDYGFSEFNADNSMGGAVDVDFGLGMDAQHDWSDGNQLELFDGFFFGNGMGNSYGS